jgi:protein-disulfide isomerase
VSRILTPPASRRERRAATRKAVPGTGRRHAPQGRPVETKDAALWRSPIILLTAGVLLVGAVLIAAMQVGHTGGASGPAQPGTRTAAGILVPMSGTPQSLAVGRTLGRADAPVHLTVWSDFQCPACRVFVTSSEPRLVSEYVATGKLRLEYRDHIIIGPESLTAAAGARCADAQGKFWPYHDVLFANQAPENTGALTAKRLADMADAVGLDITKFGACVSDGSVLAAVQADSATGQTRGNSTPTLDFGSKVIVGAPPYEQLKATIEGLLSQAGASSPVGK